MISKLQYQQLVTATEDVKENLQRISTLIDCIADYLSDEAKSICAPKTIESVDRLCIMLLEETEELVEASVSEDQGWLFDIDDEL